MPPRRAAVAMVLLSVIVPVSGASELADYFRSAGRAPEEYVLEKTRSHPVVILGEGHWIRHDVELVKDLIPALANAQVTLVTEMLPADQQDSIDRLITSDEWDAARAIAIMRSMAWPYREYLELLHEAWLVRRNHENSEFRIIGAHPPFDWRDRGIDYDAFMADIVTDVVKQGGRVVFYAGLHHGFTYYHQPELNLNGTVRGFMDRSGNILRRRLGSRVFLITLHRPFWCGSEPWDYCLPVDGLIDCAAAVQNEPVGFDVAGSPIESASVGSESYYSHGYPSLRLVDFTDGWVWFEPIEDYQLVSLIPLAEYAADPAAVDEVLANNPFSDEPVTVERLRELWAEETLSLADPMKRRRWQGVQGWRDLCR